MKNKAVIISCGDKKLNRKARAIDLYQGSYFKGQKLWALSVVCLGDVFILSAKYGLIKSTLHIEPYNIRMGGCGSISVGVLKEQALELDLYSRDVISTCGLDYKKKLDEIGLVYKSPLDGLGLGYRLKAMKLNRGKWQND